MAGRAPNVLVLFSDEHDPRHMGITGSPLARTPNLDRLARHGTRFAHAYTPSPICVPARAALATGAPVHEIGCWDNALAYDGRIEGWGHALQRAGHRVESIGKLHYLNEEAPTGFAAQHLPMHIWQGIGQVWGSVRDPLPEEPTMGRMLKEIGPGWSNYNQFDADVTAEACRWLQARAADRDEKPWVLFVGLVAPHFPLVAPQEFFDLYPPEVLEPSKLLPCDGHDHHPWIARMEAFMGQERFFEGDPARRRLAISGYLALCSLVDRHIGQILSALQAGGLADDTLVIYTSDHGDNLGARGLWGKSNLYRESTAVPMIMAGPEVPSGDVNYTPVNLTDLHATLLEALGVPEPQDGVARDSRSLLSLLGTREPERTVLSQYHAVGSDAAAFMLADARWKYHHYVGYPPELFDLRFDPEETRNLAGCAPHAETCAAFEAALQRHLGGRTPQVVDRMAKDDQNALAARFGGREKALKTGTPAATPVPGKGHE